MKDDRGTEIDFSLIEGKVEEGLNQLGLTLVPYDVEQWRDFLMVLDWDTGKFIEEPKRLPIIEVTKKGKRRVK